MKKVTKALAVAGLTLGMVGGTMVGAQAAEAATYRNQINYVAPGLCEVRQYVDYNWWEETFQGKRDTSYRLYYTSCPSTNFYF